jgi:threonine aldolase
MRSRIRGIGNESRVQPRAVSITQATEFGTIYTPEEIRALADAAHAEGLYVHMDGARMANAAATLGLGLGDISSACGVDVLSFGGTKNGALCAEAVVFFDAALAEGFQYRRKQGMQLASKMRYVAVQFTGLLADDTWRENAAHANAMTRRLADGLSALPGVRITQPVESNQIFVVLPADRVLELEEGGTFHVWRPEESEYRFVCSFATSPDEVDQFIAHARRVLGGGDA